MTGRLIQLSGVIVDLIYRVEAVPLPGHEALVHGSSLAAGGGFNAMVAARRFGVEVTYGGTLGTGPFADIVLRALEAEGIARLRPPLTGRDQGCCTVLIDKNGERSFIATAGADGILSDADLAQVRPRAEDWMLLSGYALCYAGSREALGRWLRGLPMGSPLVFDPCPLAATLAPPFWRAGLSACLWVSANAAEAAALTGLQGPAAAAQRLAADRPARGGALVRDGANGCYLALAGQDARHLPPHPVTAVDTNGAGDAHVGAFIAGLTRGEDPFRAAQLANVAAALSTTEEGPSTAPTLAAVLAALRGPGPDELVQQRR